MISTIAMLIFAAMMVSLIFNKKRWIVSVTVITWLTGFVLNAPIWPAYLMVTGIIIIFALALSALFRKLRRDRQ